MAKGYETVYLDPGSVHLTRRGDTLSMALDGVYYPRVVLRSCFPVSDNNIYISVRDATAEEQPEIGIIEDWMALDEEDRAIVAADIDSLPI